MVIKIEELNEIRKYLGIPMSEFNMLLKLSLNYRNEAGERLHEEELYGVMEEAMSNMDSNITPSRLDEDLIVAKTVLEAFKRALVNLGFRKFQKIKKRKKQEII